LVLQDAGAIRECEEHGWMRDRADPHAGQRALEMAREERPSGLPPEHCLAEIGDVLDSIGDTCPGTLFHLDGSNPCFFGTSRIGRCGPRLLGAAADRKESAMQQRRRSKHSISLKDRLASFAKEASERASKLPRGPERENLLKKARQAETAFRVDEWATAPGQHAPVEITPLLERRGQP